MDLNRGSALWRNAVRKQLCRGGTTVLVLGCLWLAWLAIHESVSRATTSQSQMTGCKLTVHSPIAIERDWNASTVAFGTLLLTLRVNRRWNQTGQKHAGDPDIARTILPVHNLFLWAMVMATYLDLAQRISWRGLPRAPRKVSLAASIALCVAAVQFKMAFTDADAPEISTDLYRFFLRPMEVASLVTQARTVFLGIAATVILTIVTRVPHISFLGRNNEGISTFHNPGRYLSS